MIAASRGLGKRLLDRAQSAEAKVAAVLALHQPGGTVAAEPDDSRGRWCNFCGATYPCATARACGVTA